MRTLSSRTPKPHPLWRGATLAGVTAAVLATGAVVFSLQEDKDAELGESVAAANLTSQAQLSPVSETLRHPGMLVGDVIGRIQQRQAMNRLFVDANDIEQARNNNALMAPASAEAAISHMGFLSERQKTDDRSFIRYDLRTLESRVEGDQIDIFLPGVGLTTKAVIEQVESVDGMLRWSGRILDFQEGGQFSVTHALQDNYAVGTFNTPVGNFSMEAKNGWGWVAPQSSDFFLPDNEDDGVHAPASDAATAPAPR